MTGKNKYKILVVDDHPIVRDGIVRLIEISGTMNICGQTGNGNEVMGLISQLQPDAIVLDLTLDSSDGFALISEIKSRYSKIPVLILSMHNESTHALRCIKAGARGYLMKKCASTEIITALRDILNGKTYASEFIKEQIINSYTDSNNKPGSINTLSSREFQIFRLYGQGLQTSEIADKLKCSPKTVETHCLRIRHKMNLNSINELIATAGAYMNTLPN